VTQAAKADEEFHRPPRSGAVPFYFTVWPRTCRPGRGRRGSRGALPPPSRTMLGRRETTWNGRPPFRLCCEARSPAGRVLQRPFARSACRPRCDRSRSRTCKSARIASPPCLRNTPAPGARSRRTSGRAAVRAGAGQRGKRERGTSTHRRQLGLLSWPAFTAVGRAVYGDRPDGFGGNNLLFGPDADWRIKPLLKSQPHSYWPAAHP